MLNNVRHKEKGRYSLVMQSEKKDHQHELKGVTSGTKRSPRINSIKRELENVFKKKGTISAIWCKEWGT